MASEQSQSQTYVDADAQHFAVIKKRKIMSRCTSLKKFQKHLILSTTYGLNKSFSKKVIVGLEEQTDGKFEPAIRVMNNCSYGITFKLNSWTKLNQEINQISAYFDSDCSQSEEWKNDVDINEYFIVFTTSHGAKAIVFDPKPEEDEEHPDDNSTKKLKLYSPSIVMQKTSFDGLKNIIPCLNERFQQIDKLTESVNLSKNFLVQAVCSYLEEQDTGPPSEEFIKQLILAKADRLKEDSQSILQPEFVKHHHEIVFLEFMALFAESFASEIKQSILEKLSKNPKQ